MKRILIICAGLCFGGVERFAANISLFSPKNEFEYHYLVFDNFPDDFGNEVLAAGAKIIRIPSPANGHIAYIKRLTEIIREGNYDVVHSHTQFNSGLNMWAAKRCGVPVRIAHSHTTKTEHKVSVKKKIYETFMRSLIRHNSTHFCACGTEAGYWMYGKKAFDRSGIVIRNGIDTDRFAYSEESRLNIRKRYGLSDDTFVIGHTGTLSRLKNQAFLISLMPEIIRKKPGAVLMLAGGGNEDTERELKQSAVSNGVGDRVIFLGGVSDPWTYINAFDVFAFPSLREGTPLALIEAQTNGLPCIVSDRLPADAILTDLVKTLPLENESEWVRCLCGAERLHTIDYAEKINQSGFGAHKAYGDLYRIYNGESL